MLCWKHAQFGMRPAHRPGDEHRELAIAREGLEPCQTYNRRPASCAGVRHAAQGSDMLRKGPTCCARVRHACMHACTGRPERPAAMVSRPRAGQHRLVFQGEQKTPAELQQHVLCAALHVRRWGLVLCTSFLALGVLRGGRRRFVLCASGKGSWSCAWGNGEWCFVVRSSV